MSTHTTIRSITMSTLLLTGIALSSADAYAARPYYKPCAAIAQELGAKITRLQVMAKQRLSQGDTYGDRRLRGLANVINAHRQNLPCVNSRSCVI